MAPSSVRENAKEIWKNYIYENKSKQKLISKFYSLVNKIFVFYSAISLISLLSLFGFVQTFFLYFCF